MASGTVTNASSGLSSRSDLPLSASSVTGAIWGALTLLGSLKITVTMFAFSILILFVGTLAQDEQTLVDVKNIYFNSWIALVPHHVFAPVTIFGQHTGPDILIPMPGGATIGLVLLINLIAAKLTRFSMHAKGTKFYVGLGLLLFGLGVTTFVILNAHAVNGLQGEPPISYESLWMLTVASVYLTAAGLTALFVFQPPKTTLMKWVLGLGIASLISLAIFFAFYQIPPAGLRIVWQLFKSLVAGIIMLFGLNLLFGKRGGNVLIHLAVGLLMLGQFVFGDRQYEEKIILQKGETSNLAFTQDEVELAIIETLPNGNEKHVAIDQDILVSVAGKGKALTSEYLPFDIRVDDWMVNSKLSAIDSSVVDNPATKGIGQNAYARKVPPVGAAKSGTNLAAAYVSIIDPASKEVIDTYLVAQEANDAAQVYIKTEDDIQDSIELDGKNYKLALRYRRNYKPYEITLEDVQQINYSGTETPRDYSSYVKIQNPVSNESQSSRIWMNNPMRFDGETFYQSEFFNERMVGVPTTGLQVVTNAGWLVPYLACVFAGLGMFAHFGQTFVRFASRFDREVNDPANVKDMDDLSRAEPYKPATSSAPVRIGPPRATGISRWLLPMIVVALVAGTLLSQAIPRKAKGGTADWYAVGKIPMQSEGRIMPLDSVARRFLQTLSGKTYTVIRGNPASTDPAAQKNRKLSAVEFFMALANGDPIYLDAMVFRIDAEEVRGPLDLNPEESGGVAEGLLGPPLKHRYSLNQLKPRFEQFQEEAERVRLLLQPKANGGEGLAQESLSFKDRKILELYSKLNLLFLTADAYRATPIPMPTAEMSEDDVTRLGQQFIALQRQMQSIDSSDVAGMVPPMLDAEEFEKATEQEKRWRALNPSVFDMQKAAFVETDFDDTATRSVYKLFQEYDQGSQLDAQKALAAHLRFVSELPAGQGVQQKVDFEAWYNKSNPFMQAIVFYIIAFVLTLLSFIFFRQPFRRSAFWICAVVFVIHTAAIVMRIYISDRPPVINLYSSAVYIGWAGVLAGLVIEAIYPIRLGVLVGTALGVLTLLVAWGLDTSDTMPVLQAVLDTQFWLTTHVQCITLGYAATFFAGFIAIYAIIHRIVAMRAPEGSEKRLSLFAEQRILYKICYGIVCFGLFFSFIGTVLGGLWADDSWGRFWGWDPKENGALMIVMWNAILLHARWDRMVAERGFYLLAIGGNIMTAWSWFGTNQLGIGLHSYGFTESVLFILTIFVASQILLIVVTAVLSRPSLDRNLQSPTVSRAH